MKILFIDDCNGYKSKDPDCDLIEVEVLFEEVLIDTFRELELTQIGVNRSGGKWEKIMTDSGFDFNIIKSGQLSEFLPNEYDEKYKLISGNY